MRRRLVLQRAERTGWTAMRRGLEAAGKELVRLEVVHALVSEKKDERVEKRCKMAEWNEVKKVCEQWCRFVLCREGQKAYAW